MAVLTVSGLLTASLAAFAVAAPTTENVERAATNCPQGAHIFLTPGHGAPPGQLGPMGSTLNLIKAAIPNSTYLRTPYKTNPDFLPNFVVEIDPGTDVLKSNITSFSAACPNTPIVLLGYSEGAIITMNALCGTSEAGFIPQPPINSSYAPQIIASIVYGDESRVPMQSYDLGTCQTAGLLPRLNPGACAPFAGNIRSYCDAADPLCCVGTGNNSNAHLEYFGIYNKNVTSYVAAQFKAFKAQQLNGTTAHA